jgi:oxygen-independent coproporphyrinogen-3 oxidase
VPQWHDWKGENDWESLVKQAFLASNKADGLSVYVHLPYCEALCTYCGCNKKITTNHAVESPYIDSLLREWQQYVQLFGRRPVIRELHLGGGTPTFFAPAALERLIVGLFALADRHREADLSFEGHPNNTTTAHLQCLYDLGFRRVSYGVQDLDPEVQRLINRVQPFEKVAEATRVSRETGYHSVNFDLVYGLPLQTAERLQRTIEQVLTLRPDRVAFYGYAHVPWKSKAQRLYDESHLPTPAERVALYLQGREQFLAAGYVDVGMDHFALPQDELAVAAAAGKLHRNFMGYTTSNSQLLIGLGASSISDLGSAFGQNSKEIVTWQRAVDQGRWSIDKGLVLSADDQQRRRLILDLSCKGEVHVPACWQFTSEQKALLEQLEADGILEKAGHWFKLRPEGKLFTRNACSLFDAYLQAPDPAVKRFSQAV